MTEAPDIVLRQIKGSRRRMSGEKLMEILRGHDLVQVVFPYEAKPFEDAALSPLGIACGTGEDGVVR